MISCFWPQWFPKNACVVERIFQKSENSNKSTPSTTVPKRSPGLFLAVPTPTRAIIGNLTPILGQLRKKQQQKLFTSSDPHLPLCGDLGFSWPPICEPFVFILCIWHLPLYGDLGFSWPPIREPFVFVLCIWHLPLCGDLGFSCRLYVSHLYLSFVFGTCLFAGTWVSAGRLYASHLYLFLVCCIWCCCCWWARVGVGWWVCAGGCAYLEI